MGSANEWECEVDTLLFDFDEELATHLRTKDMCAAAIVVMAAERRTKASGCDTLDEEMFCLRKVVMEEERGCGRRKGDGQQTEKKKEKMAKQKGPKKPT